MRTGGCTQAAKTALEWHSGIKGLTCIVPFGNITGETVFFQKQALLPAFAAPDTFCRNPLQCSRQPLRAVIQLLRIDRCRMFQFLMGQNSMFLSGQAVSDARPIFLDYSINHRVLQPRIIKLYRVPQGQESRPFDAVCGLLMNHESLQSYMLCI